MDYSTTYYATTATQSETNASTIVCAISMPSDFTVFRQRALALKLAKAKHPDAKIIEVVARQSQSPSRQQAIASSSKPFYYWEEEEELAELNQQIISESEQASLL